MAGMNQPRGPGRTDRGTQKRRRGIWGWPVRVVRVALLTYLGLVGVLFGCQSCLIYFPKRAVRATPAQAGLAYEEVNFSADDGVKLHGWFVPAPKARGTVLICHGNGGNISHRLDTIAVLRGLGLDVFIFDYRGYGRSQGRPTEQGTYRDAEAAWDYLVKTRGADPARIVILGRSLGGAVAAYLARERTPAALIVESSFTSIPDIGAEKIPIFPIRLLSRFDYDTRGYVRELKCPLLVIHSPDDRLIPLHHGQRIFEAAHKPKQFVEISGTHNEGFLTSGRVYSEAVDRFLTKHLPATAAPGPTDVPAAVAPPRDYKVVHVFVPLCDNRHQGIAAVPAALGNGQDPKGNLYWGAMYGVKTFFARSGHWTAVSAARPADEAILARCVFRSRHGGVYVVADAYDGARMTAALTDFFSAAAGEKRVQVNASVDGRTVRLRAGGDADMVCFVGHNGLMDVRMEQFPRRSGRRGPASAVVLACKSDAYFARPLRQAGAEPLITTSGLMAPEAYTLDAIVRSWAAGRSPAETHLAAAGAYAKYQRCSPAAARRLFVAGGRGAQSSSP